MEPSRHYHLLRRDAIPYFLIGHYIADETSKIRVVGFDTQQQRKLNNYHQKNIPVELINCEVKSSRYGEGYEVMLKGGTHIKESTKKKGCASINGGDDNCAEKHNSWCFATERKL